MKALRGKKQAEDSNGRPRGPGKFWRDPLSEVINTNLGVELMIAKRFDEAREQFRKTLELDPKFGIASERYAELEAHLGNYSTAQQLRTTYCPEDAKLDFGTGKEAYYGTDLKSPCRRLAWRSALDYAMLGRKDEAFRELNHFLEDDPSGANWYIRRPSTILFVPTRATPNCCAA